MFRFRLQSILEVRERLARIRQKEFSEVLFKRQTMEAQVDQHQSDLGRASGFVDRMKRSTIALQPLALYANYQRRLNSEIDLITGQIREQGQDLEEKRKALVEAKRAQRTLEILRDKAHNRYEQELNRRERSTMDEVASNYFIFNSR